MATLLKITGQELIIFLSKPDFTVARVKGIHGFLCDSNGRRTFALAHSGKTSDQNCF